MMMKKVLIVSYYWPPAGGISVLRSLKIAKHLHNVGWETIIYTVDNAQYPILEPSNEKHVPKGITILKQPCLEPFDFYKKITGRKKEDTLANVLNANTTKIGLFHKLSVWIRANFFIPDARSLWVKPSVTYLTEYIKKNHIDAIFSVGPPHTNTLIAARVSKATNTPWLMDWQDPWTEVDYYKLFPIGKLADKKHKQLEQECLKQASVTTIVSPSWKKDIEKLGAKNVDVVYWGYDAEDFQNIKKRHTDKFIISHIGLLGEDRISNAFFQALGELVEEQPSFKENFQLVFNGTTTHKVNQLITQHNLDFNTTITLQSPREEALQLALDSSINLLLLNISTNAKGRIPGKLFEYIYANNTILNLGLLDSDVNSIIQELEIGKTIEHENLEEIKRFVLDVFVNWEKDKLNVTKRHSNAKKFDHYSIENQFNKIDSLLHSISKA